MTDDRLARCPIGDPVMSDQESIASNFRVREPSISSFENVPSGVRTLAVAECTAISQIRIGSRHRHDLGDLDRLAASIADVGLLHPIVTSSDGKLVAGVRRLKACELLGWDKVPVTVVDLDKIVRGELAENFERKDFLPTEIDAIRRALEPSERTAAKKRMTLGKISTGSYAGKTRDKIGAFVGVSGRTIEKIAAVVEAAEAEPKKYGHLVIEMDRTGKVEAPHRKLLIARDEARILGLAPVPDKCRTLVIDPPWKLRMGVSDRAPPYATMELRDLECLPVASWADSNCHLYLWTPNAFISEALALMALWRFKYTTLLTWVKPRMGLGCSFRNTTEHCLFGSQGDLATRRNDIATHFEAPVGEHSEKPKRFYEIVRATSYPPYGEAFQRKARAHQFALASPGIFGSADEPKLDLLSLQRRHSIAVDQRDLSAAMASCKQ